MSSADCKTFVWVIKRSVTLLLLIHCPARCELSPEACEALAFLILRLFESDVSLSARGRLFDCVTKKHISPAAEAINYTGEYLSSIKCDFLIKRSRLIIFLRGAVYMSDCLLAFCESGRCHARAAIKLSTPQNDCRRTSGGEKALKTLPEIIHFGAGRHSLLCIIMCVIAHSH